jgi:hypothetical protein
LASGSEIVELDEACEGAVKDAEFRGKPVYAIEPGGIRLHVVDFPHAWAGLGIEGSLTAWSDLKGHVTYAAIAP